MNIRSVKTLRKHFKEELESGAAQLQAKMSSVLHNAAMNGDVSAAKYLHAHTTRVLERSSVESTATLPPFIVAQAEEPPRPEAST
jgi:hypothetical protein